MFSHFIRPHDTEAYAHRKSVSSQMQRACETWLGGDLSTMKSQRVSVRSHVWMYATYGQALPLQVCQAVVLRQRGEHLVGEARNAPRFPNDRLHKAV